MRKSHGQPLVLVLWVGRRPGPWTCRSLRRAGYGVLAAHPEGERGGRSRAALRLLRYPSPADEPDRFLAFVADVCRRRRVDAVLSLDEDIVRLLAQRPPDLAGARIVGPDMAQYEALCDKVSLGRTAAAAGVGRPAWFAAEDPWSSDGWPPLPSVVKPRSSSSWGVGGAPPALVRSAEQRAQAVAAMSSGGAVVEELIEGPQWSVHCACGPGLFVGAASLVTRSYPRGVGTPSVFDVGRPGGAAALASARRLLEQVDYAGIANVQFFERNGEMLVHDVNLRPAAGLALAMRSGIDLPRIAVGAALGRAEPLDVAAGRRFTYVAVDRELSALRDPDVDESSAGIVCGLARAAASPRTVLDPPLLDLFWLAELARRAVRRLARSAGGAAEHVRTRRRAV